MRDESEEESKEFSSIVILTESKTISGLSPVKIIVPASIASGRSIELRIVTAEIQDRRFFADGSAVGDSAFGIELEVIVIMEAKGFEEA